jgi:hypothetical protein
MDNAEKVELVSAFDELFVALIRSSNSSPDVKRAAARLLLGFPQVNEYENKQSPALECAERAIAQKIRALNNEESEEDRQPER